MWRGAATGRKIIIEFFFFPDTKVLFEISLFMAILEA